MAGWIVILGEIPDLSHRLDAFRRIFDLPGLPRLNISVFKHHVGATTVGWAWNPSCLPDLYVAENENGLVAVLCGIITDMGRYGALSAAGNPAERILELWIEHGEALIHELNGSFSCVFHERHENNTRIYSDRFASRSVWLFPGRRSTMIGNFPSAMGALSNRPPRLSASGLWSFIHAGRPVGRVGLYSEMQRLLSGETAAFSNKKNIRITSWWKRRYHPDFSVKPKEWGKLVAEALTASAKRYKTLCDSPNLFLSGGMDSRLVAAAYGKGLNALTLCTNHNVESKLAASVSRMLGLKHQTIVRSPYWYLDYADAAALIGSGSYLNQHAHFVAPVIDITAKTPYSTFTLGDLLENFSKHYFRPSANGVTYNPEQIERFLYSGLVPYTLKDARRLGIHINKDARASMRKRYQYELKKYASSLLTVSETSPDRFDTFLRWADVSITPTYNMITCIWPFASHLSLYFDNDLDDLSLKIPLSVRTEGIFLHSHILSRLSKKVAMLPDANTLMPPFVPNQWKDVAKKVRPILGSIRRSVKRLSRPKQLVLNTSGSWLLLHEMYRKDSRYKERIESTLFDSNLFPREIFDLPRMELTWREFLDGNLDLLFEIESLFSFGTLQRHISSGCIDWES